MPLNKIKPVNEQTTDTDSWLMDTENTLMVARWEGVAGLGDKGEGIKEYRLAVTE